VRRAVALRRAHGLQARGALGQVGAARRSCVSLTLCRCLSPLSVDFAAWRAQFVLNPNFLDEDAEADVSGSDDVLTTAWRVRPLSGLGAAQPLSSGTWRRVEPRLTHAEAKDCLLAAVQRFSSSRLLRDAVVHLVDENGFASNSAAFGDERGPYYTASMRALEALVAKYGDTVRNSAGAGGQRKPHTLARAVAACEYEMQRAEKAAAAARAAGSGAADSSAAPALLPAAGSDGVAARGNNAPDAQAVGAAAGASREAAGEAPGGARANRGRTNVDPRASAVALGGQRPARRACAAPPQDDPAAVQ
jgi:hypothetical protein